MIDEFQDTNEQQKELLYLLSLKDDSPKATLDPRHLVPDKLFCVGDDKQSIYRFRGADVTVFRTLLNETMDAGGSHFELPINYRSHPALVEAFNRLFAQVMGDAHHNWEAQFRSMEAGRNADDGDSSFRVWRCATKSPADAPATPAATADTLPADADAAADCRCECRYGCRALPT